MEVLKCQRESKSSVILLKRLVEFAEDIGIRGSIAARRGRRVARGEAINTAEEARDSFDAGVDPIHIFFQRSGEKGEEAGGVGPISRRPHRRVRHCLPISTSSRRCE